MLAYLRNLNIYCNYCMSSEYERFRVKHLLIATLFVGTAQAQTYIITNPSRLSDRHSPNTGQPSASCEQRWGYGAKPDYLPKPSSDPTRLRNRHTSLYRTAKPTITT